MLKKCNIEQTKTSIIETNLGNKYAPAYIEDGVVKYHIGETVKILSELREKTNPLLQPDLAL